MKTKRLLSLLLVCVLLLSFVVACKKDKSDIDGNGGGSATVDFWGWGDPDEVRIFSQLVKDFEKANSNIKVNYQQKPSSGYADSARQALSGRNGPDVVYVGDGDVKSWVANGGGQSLLRPLDDYLKTSKEIEPSNMWASSIDRYRIDRQTWQSGEDYPLYAVPKDIGPSVVYYNVDALKTVGVKIISVDETDIDEFNNGAQDRYGKTKTDYGITVDIKPLGYDSENKIFNNRIAMLWDDSVSLFSLLTKKGATANNGLNPNSPTDYGFFTDNWFSYAWSVGGDVIKLDSSDNKYKFTMDDNSKMWLSTDGQFYPTQGEAGAGATQMSASMRDGMSHFVRLGQPKDGKDVDGQGNTGFGVTPLPMELGSQDKIGYFSSGHVAMVVDGRWSTVNLRNNAKFDWDVCPLPKSPNGVEAGHSGSMGIAISAKSKVPNASWKFAEFIAGKTGQEAQAKTGFNVPNQIDLANSEVFLQSDKKPANAEIFLRAAKIQKPGDWHYLQDNAWISEWAPVLNDEVRQGRINLIEFYNKVRNNVNEVLKKYT